jgi:hypothetical protein
MVEKISPILNHRQHQVSLDMAKGILSLAAHRIPYHDIIYLEVTEEGNFRKSFDINMYRAGLRLSELSHFLTKICRHFSISPDQFYPLYESVKEKVFGHLSGGIDREGKDFLTVYYGVEGLRDARAGSPPKSNSHPLKLPHKNSTIHGVERDDEKARNLYRLINGLNVNVGLERSFKIFQNTLLTDRFLIGFRRNLLRQERHEDILNICRKIRMPEDFLGTFQKYLSESNIVLFGFEKNEKNRIYKAYLEFADRIGEAVRRKPESPEPVLIHLGFKWDAMDNSYKTAARYTAFPAFTSEDILERVNRIFYGPELKPLFEIMEGVITLGTGKVGPGAFLYFEAEEGDNPRASFDINMYLAKLQVNELYPLLLDMIRHFSIPRDRFNRIYEKVNTCRFGHLTGGKDREGRDFFTVYFWEKESPA